MKVVVWQTLSVNQEALLLANVKMEAVLLESVKQEAEVPPVNIGRRIIPVKRIKAGPLLPDVNKVAIPAMDW
ncbi:hypothetical protein GF407_17245 [candidate division KSB1 bacterium]|nr:hypothetical protein [candidate division KSB1 bacterium]